MGFLKTLTAAHQAHLSSNASQNLLEFISIDSVMLSDHLILYHPFFFCLQSFPASGSFLMSWLFSSGGQSIRASDTASVLPKNNQGWSTLGLTGLISFQSKGLLKSLLQHHSSKASVLRYSAFFIVLLSHSYMTSG